jgi:hypothetical protein
MKSALPVRLEGVSSVYIAVEGMRAPRHGKPGRAYLAVPYDIAPAQVIGNHPAI